jgi:hypothetical protein
MDAEALVALLAEYVRLRVFAAIALGAVTVGQVQSMTGFTESDVSDAVRRLADGGLVALVDGGLVVQIGVLQAAAGLAEPAGRATACSARSSSTVGSSRSRRSGRAGRWCWSTS